MNIDTLVTEICLQRDRIAELEQGIKDHISQLIDGGMNEKSIIITSLKTLLK